MSDVTKIDSLRRQRLWTSIGLLSLGLTWGIVSMWDPRSPGDWTPLQSLLVIGIFAGLLPAGAVWLYFTSKLGSKDKRP